MKNLELFSGKKKNQKKKLHSPHVDSTNDIKPSARNND